MQQTFEVPISEQIPRKVMILGVKHDELSRRPQVGREIRLEIDVMRDDMDVVPPQESKPVAELTGQVWAQTWPFFWNTPVEGCRLA